MKTYIDELKQNGYLDSFSENHFIIRALNNDCTYFDNISVYSNPLMSEKSSLHIPSTFLVNFSQRLKGLSKHFGEDKILEFVENQLSAGKKNYSEAQFFRAYSEVTILSYFMILYGDTLFEQIYEPQLGYGKKNPEARLKFDDGVIIDIEVKTPGFPQPKKINKTKNGLLKPNVVLTDYQLNQLEKYCSKKDFDFQRPRVGKLKDFIVSACKKFENPIDEKHFNLLFINWTYNDFPELSLEEPITLLVNDASGIIENEKVLSMLGIDEAEISKLSGIILYKDNFENLITCDFRHHFIDKSVKLICNRKFNTKSDYDLLCEKLMVNPYNLNMNIEFFPVDYIKTKQCDEKILVRAMKYFENIIYADTNLLKGIYPDVDIFRTLRRQAITHQSLTKKDRFPV